MSEQDHATSSFRDPKRVLGGLTAPLERRVLAALAARLPRWVGSDHLTGLGVLGMLGAGLAYWWSREVPSALHLVNLALLVNWFGDSLDGTLARHRQCCRPRYGFYVDHMLDAFGILFILGGLALSGLISPAITAALLVAYYLMSINVALATHSLGVFRISFGPVGGTELRIVLAALNLAVLHVPLVTLAGQAVRVFDVVGGAAAVGLLVATVATAAQTTRALYRLEPLPRASQPASARGQRCTARAE
jgi:archaetidylinositol phosphate synthase